MSVNANYSGNVQKPVHKVLSGTSAETIGSAAANDTETVSSWSIVNPTAGSVNCALYWNDGTTDNLVWRKAVAANSTEVESNLPIRLRSGHSIKVAAASTVTVTLVKTAVVPVS
mgnify:CR=1 FL=1